MRPSSADGSGSLRSGVLFLLVLLGMITQLRVFNTATEDLVYVLAMNRLRAAYIDLDPGIETYFMMGTTDDLPGTQQTYYPFAARDRSQVFASSMMLILVVHAGARRALHRRTDVRALGLGRLVDRRRRRPGDRRLRGLDGLGLPRILQGVAPARAAALERRRVGVLSAAAR